MQLYESFIARSSHLGNWNVASCKAELSNKMVSDTADQKMFTKTSYPFVCSDDKRNIYI
jgi:hypothetical protein